MRSSVIRAPGAFPTTNGTKGILLITDKVLDLESFHFEFRAYFLVKESATINHKGHKSRIASLRIDGLGTYII